MGIEHDQVMSYGHIVVMSFLSGSYTQKLSIPIPHYKIV